MATIYQTLTYARPWVQGFCQFLVSGPHFRGIKEKDTSSSDSSANTPPLPWPTPMASLYLGLPTSLPQFYKGHFDLLTL